MNASIHNYSLSISRSPRRLVVVFSSPLQEKKAIKAGQKQARTEAVYLGKKTHTQKGVGCREWVGVILQTEFTLSLSFSVEKPAGFIWTFMHECNVLQETHTSTPFSIYILIFLSVCVYVCECAQIGSCISVFMMIKCAQMNGKMRRILKSEGISVLLSSQQD